MQKSDTVFLLFWKSDCPYCEIAIKQLVKRTSNKKAPLITISFDIDSTTYWQAIKDKQMQNFSNYCNFKGFANSDIAKKFGVTKTPPLL